MTQVRIIRDETDRVVASVYLHPAGTVDIEAHGLTVPDVCQLTAVLLELHQTQGFDFQHGRNTSA